MPDVERHEWEFAESLPADERRDECNTQQQKNKNIARFPPLWSISSKRQARTKQSNPSHTQQHAKYIKLLQRSKIQLLDTILGFWHRPNSSQEKEQIDDSQHPKTCSPPKQLIRHPRENTPQHEPHGIPRAKTSKRPILPLRRDRIRGPQDPHRRRHSGRGPESQDAGEDIKIHGICGEAGDQARDAEGAHGEDQQGAPTKSIRHLGEEEEEGAGTEGGRGVDPGDLRAGHGEGAPDGSGDDGADAVEETRHADGHGGCEDEETFLDRGGEAGGTVTVATATTITTTRYLVVVVFVDAAVFFFKGPWMLNMRFDSGEGDVDLCHGSVGWLVG